MPAPRRNLLVRVLEEPRAVAAVQSLDGPTFHALIDRLGVADAGELVAMATDRQLQHLLDETLWSHEPGRPEDFSKAAFVTWLEVLREGGDEALVHRLCALPEELIALGMHQVVLVLEADALGIDMAGAAWEEAEDAERALDACLYMELDGYMVIARGGEGWDAVIAALVALDREHHDMKLRLLDRCHRASRAYIEDQGSLYDVLTSEEMLESDVRAAREERRSQEGYVDPPSARAFLELARTTPLDPASDVPRDIITTRYFRDLEPSRKAPSGGPSTTPPADLAPLQDLLRDLGVELTPTPLPLAPATPNDRFRAAMTSLAERAPAVHAQRLAELVYLTQVLVAGERNAEGNVYALHEAAEEAVRRCREGFEHGLRRGDQNPTERLRHWTADVLFRWGTAARGRNAKRHGPS